MKRALTAAALLGGLWLLAPAAQAQTGTARGKVLDDKGQPLEDAKIMMEFQGGITRKYETKTNKKGEYTQVGLQPGPYKFTANKEGFQPSFIEVQISLGDPTAVPDFKLTPGGGPEAAAGGRRRRGAARQLPDGRRARTTPGKLDEAEAAYKAILAPRTRRSPRSTRTWARLSQRRRTVRPPRPRS